MNKTLKQKQLEFLEETVSFYNSENRSVHNLNNECVYYNNEKPGCAIGRHIDDKDLCKDLDAGLVKSISFTSNFNRLPQKLQDLTKNFLVCVQILHDTEGNWNSQGISEAGKKICRRY